MEIKNNTKIQKAYEIMQNQYVMQNKDRIEFKIAIEHISKIHNGLMSNPSWHNCNIQDELNDSEDFGINLTI